MAVPLLVLVDALYAAVATAYLEARRRREPAPAWARIVGPFTVACHLAGLVALSDVIGRSPFATSAQSVSFLAFSLTALYLVMEMTSRVATHGGGFYGAATILAALSVPGLVGAEPAASTVPPDAIRTVHVGLALMGTAAILAGGLLAIGYLGAYRRMKEGRVRLDGQGPSLRGLERLARVASLLGVLLLGPALVLGAKAAARGGVTAEMLALVGSTAVLFVLVLAAGWIWWRKPLRGALAAWLNLGGVAVVVVAFGVVHPLVLRGVL